MLYWQLILSFLKIGLLSIGGGYAAIPLIRAEMVLNHGWLSAEDFSNLVTIAEMTPGPIAVNAATFVGIRVAGVPGAVLATLACILPSCLIVSCLFFIYRRWQHFSAVDNSLKMLRPAVVALIAAAALVMLRSVLFGPAGELNWRQFKWLGAILFAAAFWAIRRRGWNPILVMLGCGLLSLLTGLLVPAL